MIKNRVILGVVLVGLGAGLVISGYVKVSK